MIEKNPAIRDLVDRLDLERRGWMVVDYWEADLCAIGIARKNAPRQLVYVNTLDRDAGRFDYEAETPDGSTDTDYEVADRREDVDFDTLVAALEKHLG